MLCCSEHSSEEKWCLQNSIVSGRCAQGVLNFKENFGLGMNAAKLCVHINVCLVRHWLLVVDKLLEIETDLPYLFVLFTLASPNGNFDHLIAVGPADSADLFGNIRKNIAHHGHGELEPHFLHEKLVVQFVLLNGKHQAATMLIHRILPNRAYSFLKQRIVAARGSLSERHYLIVDAPKLFHTAAAADWQLRLLPGEVVLQAKVPKGPRVLQKVSWWAVGVVEAASVFIDQNFHLLND